MLDVKRCGLTPVQCGMVFHSLEGSLSDAYVEQIVGELGERLDVRCFERAWLLLAQRHEQLRMSINFVAGEMTQEIVELDQVPLHVEDLSHETADSQRSRIEAFLQADRLQRFDLRRAPLFRVAVFLLDPSRTTFVWTFHHVLLDGGAFAEVLRELFAAYEALVRGEEPSFSESTPFSEYLSWLGARDQASDEVYWRAYMQGASLTVLPGDFVPSERSRQREVAVELSRDQSAALRKLAESLNVSLATVIDVAWGFLLRSFANRDDVVWGSVRSLRRATVPGAERLVGNLINTVPMRLSFRSEETIAELLGRLRRETLASRVHQHAALVDIHRWSGFPPSSSLFNSVVIYDPESLDAQLRHGGDSWEHRCFRLIERTNYPVTLYAQGDPCIKLKLVCRDAVTEDDRTDQMMEYLVKILAMLNEHADKDVASFAPLSPRDTQVLTMSVNDTELMYSTDKTIHASFDEAVLRHPDRVALVHDDQSLTYAQLAQKANRLAEQLSQRGVACGDRVAIYLSRSCDMVIALLGVLKSGAAYVPLDAVLPQDRIDFMLRDADACLTITEPRLERNLPPGVKRFMMGSGEVEGDADAGRAGRGTIQSSKDPAYVIYTSGSTGRPKGVVVTHRNVANLCAGLDVRIPGPKPGVFLSLTSISFDISVLEIFWSLTRGFTVVIASVDDAAPQVTVGDTRTKPIQFSLMFFGAGDERVGGGKYDLLMQAAEFADRHGFTAIWTPERHFHAFGAIFPSPDVISAAVAARTRQIQLRAGSVVLPLHDPIRVAENWSVVDNLSGGRVGLSVTSGWHVNDFVLSHGEYAKRKQAMIDGVETIRQLWRGDAVTRRNGDGNEVAVSMFPRPVQTEPPIWLTASGNPETFRLAGQMGCGVLTHLLGQNLESVAERVRIYRESYQAYGVSQRNAHVTIMLHTYIGDELQQTRDDVRRPMMDYIQASSGLVTPFLEQTSDELPSDEQLRMIWEGTANRYIVEGSLIGTQASALLMVDHLREIGVDEIACLIDFGMPDDQIMASLEQLAEVYQQTQRRAVAQRGAVATATSTPPLHLVAEAIRRHGVTHLQVTPSLARILLASPAARSELQHLQCLLVGGEAISPGLAKELVELIPGAVLNMYGPTETTVWSSAFRLDHSPGDVAIGKPLPNTRILVVNDHLQPVPVGVPGEIVIGGDGVAAGYWCREDLTQERFVSARLLGREEIYYRTGDVGRVRPDGNVEFLGRRDSQVKLRGYRIELEEIEAVIGSFEGVRQAAAVVRREEDDIDRLVAYVAPAESLEAREHELRQRLAAVLPHYMVPDEFVFLQELPRTPSQKLDRRALPKPGRKTRSAAVAFAAPASELEKSVATIFSEVLNVSAVGREDNFFDLGGHSLHVVSVVAKVRDRHDYAMEIVELFQFPTVRALAARILASDAPDPVLDAQDRSRLRQSQMQHRARARQSRRTGAENDGRADRGR